MTELAIQTSALEQSESEWEDQGREIATRITSTCWEVGDWLIVGEAEWGERYKRASEITGLQEQTLRAYAYVARRFDLLSRRYKLSWAHYQAVAAIPEEASDLWLQIAEKQHLTLAEFRKVLPRQLPPGKPEIVVSVYKITVPRDHDERWRQAAEQRGLEVQDWLIAVADEAAQQQYRKT